LVVATKRAVGAEYGYQVPSHSPRPQQHIRVRVRRRLSPMACMAAGICLVTLLFCIGLSYIYVKALKAQLYYQINMNKQAVLTINAENDKLELEIARLKSLDRIEDIATQKLGMIKNPEVQYLVLQDRNENAKPGGLPANIAAVPEETTEVSTGKKLMMQLASVFSKTPKVEKG